MLCPRTLVGAEALYAGLDSAPALITVSAEESRGNGVVVIGAVQGDVHDIGKNLVKMMLEVAGFDVHDLGRDVEMERFIEESQRLDADLLCLSALMTTTMVAMKDYMARFQEELPGRRSSSAAPRFGSVWPISGAPTVTARTPWKPPAWQRDFWVSQAR